MRLAQALPLLMLAANLLAWWRWGTDLPFLDDWRAYDERNALSFAPERLFEAINNTITPVGLALDAMAQRLLGGNPLPYQTLSMLLVLGGLLWLQWRLLCWALRDRGLATMAWVFCVFMLQSGTYWGEQNLAYHQALPLLALLAATSLNFRGARSGPSRVTGVAVLGVVAGFSYVSGAIAAFVMGLAWVLLGWWFRRPLGGHLAQRGRSGGCALMLAGAATSTLQIWLTRRPGTRKQITELTWPWESDFWSYMAGKIGRSTGHGFQSLAAEVSWVAVLMVLVAGAAWLVLRRVGNSRLPMRRLSVVLLPLLVAVVAYLGLVSLGRAGYRDASIQGFAGVFRFGYERFHFFWVTLLFPWVAAAWGLWCLRRFGSRPRGNPSWRSVALVLGLVCVVAGIRGVFDVGRAYRNASEYRASEIRCLHRQLGSGGPVVCPGYELMDIHDLAPAYAYAREIGASFVRYFPIVEPEGPARWLLRWPEEPSGTLKWIRMAPTLADEHRFEAGDDAQIWFDGADHSAFLDCRLLEVQVAVRSREASSVQVFHLAAGDGEDFSERASSSKPIPGNWALAERRFLFESPSGFLPRLRIDPLAGPGSVRIESLRAHCRLPRFEGARP